MKTEFEYIVLGLGGLGSAAAYWLARHAGQEVLGIEQFELGHVRGESQDHSRIIRLSYHTPFYVELAKKAYAAWAALESDCHESLILKTGGLDLWPPGASIPMRDYTESLRNRNVPFEVMQDAEIMRQYPQWTLPAGTIGLFQTEGGIAPAARCNAAHQNMAREHGATLRENAPVSLLQSKGDEVIVIAGDTHYRAHKLVVAAGPWTNQALAHFGIKLPLTITQEQVTYFTPWQTEPFQPERFPIWIWMDEPSFYGFPIYGENAVKVGQDVGGQEVTAETRTFEPNLDTLARVEDFTKTHLPWAAGNILYTKTCLYTLTPDRDFVIDSIPNHPNCWLTIGAGHAYKYAGIIGRILSELAIYGRTPIDLSSFSMTRKILMEENPPKSFMI